MAECAERETESLRCNVSVPRPHRLERRFGLLHIALVVERKRNAEYGNRKINLRSEAHRTRGRQRQVVRPRSYSAEFEVVLSTSGAQARGAARALDRSLGRHAASSFPRSIQIYLKRRRADSSQSQSDPPSSWKRD